MQLLLDYGADPCHANNKKNAPLHIACAIQNKKACRVLIEHGANIAQENWQYQKPHEMVTERDKVSSTQAYLNLIQETWVEKIANKEVFGNVTRYQRSYYRSIYDIADATGGQHTALHTRTHAHTQGAQNSEFTQGNAATAITPAHAWHCATRPRTNGTKPMTLAEEEHSRVTPLPTRRCAAISLLLPLRGLPGVGLCARTVRSSFCLSVLFCLSLSLCPPALQLKVLWAC